MILQPARRGRRPIGKVWDAYLKIWVPEDPVEREDFHALREQRLYQQRLKECREREAFEKRRKERAEQDLAEEQKKAEDEEKEKARRAEEARMEARLARKRAAERMFKDPCLGCNPQTKVYYFDADGNFQMLGFEKSYEYKIKMFDESSCKKPRARDIESPVHPVPDATVRMGKGIEAACREARQRRADADRRLLV